MTVNPSDLWLPASVEFTEEETLARKQAQDAFYQLAEQIKDYYAAHPDADIKAVRKALDASYSDVVFVLNEFAVTENGVEHVGPGQGGGWAPSVEPEFAPKQLGNRWPDGSLRKESFDAHNPDHIAALEAEADAAVD